MAGIARLRGDQDIALQEFPGKGFSDATCAACDHYIERGFGLSPISPQPKAIQGSKKYSKACSQCCGQPERILKNICTPQFGEFLLLCDPLQRNSC